MIGPQGEALPALYADFGTVTSGMDVVQKIEALPTDARRRADASGDDRQGHDHGVVITRS